VPITRDVRISISARAPISWNYLATAFRVWMLAGLPLVALVSTGGATTPRLFGPADCAPMPDPLHVADSAVGIALVRCTRVDGVHPDRFRVERLLGGMLPDSFTVRGHGYYEEGQRCMLVLARRPKCLETFAPRLRRYAQDFDAIRIPQITGEFPSYSSLPLDDPKIIQIGQSLWRPREQSPQELRRRLHLWLTRTGGEWQATLATEVLTRHPELRDDVMEAELLGYCRGPASWWGRTQSASTLSLRPDSAIRATSRSLRTGAFDDRYAAVLLVARDTLPESRAWLVSAIRDPNDLVAETAIEALEPERYPGERRALLHFALETELAMHRLTASIPAAAAIVIDSIGGPMVDPNRLRVAALKRLGTDTSAVVRGAIARTLHERSYQIYSNDEGEYDMAMTLESGVLSSCWTRDELVMALSDSLLNVRMLAYRETARRKDDAAARLVLERLEADRQPDGKPLDRDEVIQMIAALGAIGDTLAIPELARRVDLPNAFAFGGMRNWEIRAAAVEALGKIDDAKALGLIRTLAASVAHDTTWVQAKWNALNSVPEALTGHGDSTDVPFYRKLAALRADQLRTAAHGIASVAGPEAFFEFLEDHKITKLRLTDALYIDAWVSETCRTEGRP
jgi:HEAT repeat protein